MPDTDTAPLFTVGQRVSFAPPAGGETGTVSEVQDARRPEYICHAYVIEADSGQRVHRWQDNYGESVAAMDPALLTLADAVARVGLHGQLLSGFSRHLYTVTSIDPIRMRRESDGHGHEGGGWSTGQQWLIAPPPPEPEQPVTHNLFIATALAGGPGGIIRNREASADARIVSCDSHADGEVVIITIEPDGAPLPNRRELPLLYSAFTDATWRVVSTAEANAEPPKPEAAPRTPRSTIPRDMDELGIMRAHAENVQEMFPTAAAETGRYLRALTELEQWLHGGKKQRSGHALAGVEDADESEALCDETGVYSIGLCGEYEAIVCTTFGWLPRRGEESSMMRLVEAWRRDVVSFEQQNEHLNAAALIELWLANYAPGGLFNTAVVDHIEGHLEDHKVDDANTLLESFGWSTAQQEREYELRVRVTREVTVYEESYISITQTATSAEDAIEGVDRYAVSGHLDYADWTQYDQGDGSDWEVDEVELDG